MKTSRLGNNKISEYYRTSGYVTSLERVAKSKNSSIYPYLLNEMMVNRSQGLNLCPVETTSKVSVDRIKPIDPIEEDDCYA